MCLCGPFNCYSLTGGLLIPFKILTSQTIGGNNGSCPPRIPCLEMARWSIHITEAIQSHMEVSINGGTPRWMVCEKTNHDLRAPPSHLGNLQMGNIV